MEVRCLREEGKRGMAGLEVPAGLDLHIKRITRITRKRPSVKEV